MSSKGKKNATQVRIDEAEDDAGNAGNVTVPVNVNMTFEQQLQLMKCQDEIRERELVRERERAAIERDRAALKEAELRLQLELARADVGPGVGAANRAFDVSKASSMLPTYSEKDLEMYLSNFEKTAEASAWPKEKWAVILQPKLSGKALKAYDKLSVNDLNDYEIVKEAILDELELVAEVYRVRFRNSTKRPTETYCDYANFMTVQFDRWLKCTDVTNFYGLRQLMLIEKFCEAVPQDFESAFSREIWIQCLKLLRLQMSTQCCDEVQLSQTDTTRRMWLLSSLLEVGTMVMAPVISMTVMLEMDT